MGFWILACGDGFRLLDGDGGGDNGGILDSVVGFRLLDNGGVGLEGMMFGVGILAYGGLLYILCIDKHTQKSIKSYT